MLCNPYVRTEEQLVTAALLVYAVYRGTNHYRHEPKPAPDVLNDALVQWVREGARGHRNSMRVLGELWRTSCSYIPLPPRPVTFISPVPRLPKRRTHEQQSRSEPELQLGDMSRPHKRARRPSSIVAVRC